ncbi:hypothetical protein QAD02_014150 [Eretmocerus hayati]|uniref:Uncharacterized protein n=1 Tax=Eretmocerus hayati TaxID=131215 RepID=A0ACC2P5J1_9HYME|nr:hypothetical protein QAD02_014150 [Eretmocerus hayati]
MQPKLEAAALEDARPQRRARHAPLKGKDDLIFRMRQEVEGQAVQCSIEIREWLRHQADSTPNTASGESTEEDTTNELRTLIQEIDDTENQVLNAEYTWLFRDDETGDSGDSGRATPDTPIRPLSAASNSSLHANYTVIGNIRESSDPSDKKGTTGNVYQQLLDATATAVFIDL